MKPIYFPFTYIPEAVANSLSRFLGRIVLLQPVQNNQPDLLRRLEEGSYIEIHVPFTEEEDRLIACSKDFQHWGHLHQGEESSLKGDEIIINLKTGIGTILNGSIFIEKSHFFIRGDQIHKTGEDSYTIKNASVTTCDGDIPPWQITGKEVKITIEDTGTVHHAALWSKKLPVFYFPYITFPLNTKRQSGLLAPQGGYSSRNGIEFIQPYYWVINQMSDATFYYHHIQDRGEKFGAEYRYALSNFSKGLLMVDTLNDRKVDDGTGDSSQKWGYTDDAFLRKNTDRYWFRMKLNQELPRHFTSKLDLDIVSDQDYLDEFTSGYTGYNTTKKLFESEFGRDIDDKNDSVRTNSLNVNRIWSQYSLNAELLWYDNVVNRRQDRTDPTLQQLPNITFNALKQSVLKNMLFADMDSEFANFYRKDGMTGQRVDVHPRIFLPMNYKNYFTFEPSVGFRQTVWNIDHVENELPEMNDSSYQHREIYDLKAELSTDLFNVFQVNGNSINKIKHTLIPRLEYSYIPDMDQSEYPLFDETDRIDPENLMTFSLTNLLISKSQGAGELNSDTPFKNADELSALDSYNQFVWFKVAQSYDFRMRNETGFLVIILIFIKNFKSPALGSIQTSNFFFNILRIFYVPFIVSKNADGICYCTTKV